MHLGIVQVNLTLLLVFTVFATMMAESWYKTGMEFQIVRKLAFKRKGGRPARETEGLSHHEWGFSGFCFHHSPSSSPELLTNVFEVTSLLTPSLMAIAFTVAVFVRVMASLYRALALVGALPSVV